MSEDGSHVAYRALLVSLSKHTSHGSHWYRVDQAVLVL